MLSLPSLILLKIDYFKQFGSVSGVRNKHGFLLYKVESFWEACRKYVLEEAWPVILDASLHLHKVTSRHPRMARPCPLPAHCFLETLPEIT